MKSCINCHGEYTIHFLFKNTIIIFKSSFEKTVNSGSFEANYDFLVQHFTIKSKVGL